MTEPIRIAMWSGPRNISTALLRSWGNRADTYVCDEPLYAHYLKVTGRRHPGTDEVIAAQENDWRKVVAWLTGPIPEGRSVFYQKHMAHHLLPEIDDRAWLDDLSSCFLIREPEEMLTSLMKILPDPRLPDTGLPQQIEIFERESERTGRTPPVVEARDVLDEPERILGALCERLGVEFDEAMLSWPPGARDTDGVWARHWYDQVVRTTSFRPYKPKNEPVPDELRPLLAECLECYERLASHRIR
jgi:hypothetical protein